MNVKSELHKFTELLAVERDELRLQIHLFAAEAASEWEEVEEKWHKFESKVAEVSKSGKDSASDFVKATKQLGHEIGEAYSKFRESL